MEDHEFLTIALQIIQRNNCSVIEINIENRILDIDGTDENIQKCCTELEDLLGDYLI